MAEASGTTDSSEIRVKRSRRGGIESTEELELLTARTSVDRGGEGGLEDPETGKVS